MGTTEEELGRVARRQHGLLAREQAIALGLSESAVDRRLRSRQWLRYLPGVYRMPGVPDTDHQRILGACLAVGGGAMASHRTAAFLWGLGPLPRQLEVSAAPHTRRALAGVVVHGPRDFALAGKARRFGIPVTHLARTLVDLAATLSARDLEVAFDAAWRQRKDLPKWVARYLADLGARQDGGARAAWAGGVPAGAADGQSPRGRGVGEAAGGAAAVAGAPA